MLTSLLQSSRKLYLRSSLNAIQTIFLPNKYCQCRFISDTTSQRLWPYKKLEKTDIEYFTSILSSKSIIQDRELLVAYNKDWIGTSQGKSKLVLRPKTTKEVSQILRYCNEKCLAVVPQGGNTGLVGGSVPINDEVILSLSNMNKIIDFDEPEGVLICEAGCILENLNEYVGQHNHIMPLDLGAKGTCQIGGNIAANAAGIRLVRYHSMHANVLGLEVVLPNGEIVDLLKTIRKDNTGYDLKQLFIGSEGTLGVITKAAIFCPAAPTSTHVALLGCNDFSQILECARSAKHSLKEILSAIEFMDRDSLESVLSYNSSMKDPLEQPYKFYVMIETSGSNEAHDMEKIESFLTSIMEKDETIDGIMAQDHSQSLKLFSMREEVPVAIVRKGYTYKFDVSLPSKDYYKLVEDTKERLKGHDALVVGYGHLADNNIHLNVVTKEYDEEVLGLLEPFVFEWIAERNGSVSAEHGIGKQKPRFLHLSKSEKAIKIMEQIKGLFDPKNIMNPYKVLPTLVNTKAEY